MGKNMPKYCPECGEKVEGNPKFCPKCGNKLSIDGVSAKKTSTVEDHRRTLSTVYLIAGILSILLPLIIYWFGVVM